MIIIKKWTFRPSLSTAIPLGYYLSIIFKKSMDYTAKCHPECSVLLTFSPVLLVIVSYPPSIETFKVTIVLTDDQKKKSAPQAK